MENTPLYYQSVPDGTYQPAEPSRFGFAGVVTHVLEDKILLTLCKMLVEAQWKIWVYR